jgi:hypothetical protein
MPNVPNTLKPQTAFPYSNSSLQVLKNAHKEAKFRNVRGVQQKKQN